MLKRILIVILSLVIVIISIYIFINRDHIFDSKAEIHFVDGCTEIYINGNLTTPLCISAREELNKTKEQKIAEKLQRRWGNITI
jgi:preprotein translocase subunit SecF